MTGCRTPVVIFAFNRPDKLRRLLSLVALAQPAALFAVVDGARPDHPDDASRRHEVLRLLDHVPWPCDIRRNISDTNLGCDARITSGLDWVFAQVEQAIVLEDDLIPHPEFFGWCSRLLDRYHSQASIHCVSGRNDLVRWGDGRTDHVLVHRGSNLGFGTWQRAWRAARAVGLPGPDTQIAGLLTDGLIDPQVAGHFEWLRRLSASGFEHGWDTKWELQRALLGGLSAVSTVNLVAHGGFDEDATHARRSDNLRAMQPVGAPRQSIDTSMPAVDHRLDRWGLFLQLMETCRNPHVARLLARSPTLVTDANTRHHLRPFAQDADTPDALRHLQESGCRSKRLDALVASFKSAGSP